MKCKYYINEKWGKGVKVYVREKQTYIWLPKSQVKIEDNYVVEIPEWLAKKNKLNAELTPTT